MGAKFAIGKMLYAAGERSLLRTSSHCLSLYSARSSELSEWSVHRCAARVRAGEHVVINGLVANRAPVAVYAIEVRLVQHVVYALRNGRRVEEHNAVSQVRDDKPVARGEGTSFSKSSIYLE